LDGKSGKLGWLDLRNLQHDRKMRCLEYGDYTETVSDGFGNFYGIWAEGESYLGSGDVYYSKF